MSCSQRQIFEYSILFYSIPVYVCDLCVCMCVFLCDHLSIITGVGAASVSSLSSSSPISHF